MNGIDPCKYYLHLLSLSLALIAMNWIQIVTVVVRLMVLNYCRPVYRTDHHLSQYCRAIRVMRAHHLHGVMAIPTD